MKTIEAKDLQRTLNWRVILYAKPELGKQLVLNIYLVKLEFLIWITPLKY